MTSVYQGYTRGMTATTIKVPVELRDRLNSEAREAGLTVAGVIERLLAARDRAALYEQMRAERARMTPDERVELEAEYRLWSDASGEDLLHHEART